jgi:hypothetical protein
VLAVPATLLAAAVLAACGGDDGDTGRASGASERPDPTSDVRSGVVDGSVKFGFHPRGKGTAVVSRTSFHGPFERDDARGLPDFDLMVRMKETGEEAVRLRAIATPSAGYVEFHGRPYEIDDPVFERLGSAQPLSELRPSEWIASPSTEGHEEIDGTQTIHTSGSVRVQRMLQDIEQATREVGLSSGVPEVPPGFFDKAALDLFTGSDDQVLRRFDLELAWHGKTDDISSFAARLDVSVTVTRINRPQRIEAPANPAPFQEAIPKLSLELSGLGEFLGDT